MNNTYLRDISKGPNDFANTLVKICFHFYCGFFPIKYVELT